MELAEWLEHEKGTQWDPDNKTILWTGSLDVGQVVTWSWTVTHTGEYGHVITNTAEYEHPGSQQDGSASATFSVVGAPVLSITKSVTPESGVTPHGAVTYTVSLSNQGAGDAEGVLLTDTLAAAVEFDHWLENPPDTELTDGTITWAGRLAAGEVVTWSRVVNHIDRSQQNVVTNTARYAYPGGGSAGEAQATFSVGSYYYYLPAAARKVSPDWQD